MKESTTTHTVIPATPGYAIVELAEGADDVLQRIPIVAWLVDVTRIAPTRTELERVWGSATPITAGYAITDRDENVIVATPDGLFLGFERVFKTEAEVIAELNRQCDEARKVVVPLVRPA